MSFFQSFMEFMDLPSRPTLGRRCLAAAAGLGLALAALLAAPGAAFGAPPKPVISYSPSTEVFTKGTAIAPMVPTNTGGAVVTWTIAPALSAGLVFNVANGEITGTPTALRAATNYTVKATNAGGSGTAVVTLTVNDIPPVISYTPAAHTFTKGTAIAAVIPASTGGAVVSWFVAPALPAGLAFSAATGRITGTPTVISPATAYTITATNTGGTATAALTLTVNDKIPAFHYAPAVDTYTTGTAIPVLSPVSTGGTVVTWSVAPALPAGLGLDPATGQISGTPTVVSPQTTYTITGSNTGGSATAKVKITVDAVPPTVSYSPSTEVFTKGTAIAPMVPTTTGGAVVTWTIAPALSAGLAFNVANGEITGTPTALRAATNYTVKATNTGGSGTAVVTLTVDDIPPVIDYTPAAHTFTKGTAIAAVIPTSTGGAVVTWSVAPPLPAGLTLSAVNGRITGTPTAVSPATAYTITGTNSGGTATATLTLTVDDKAPAFSYVPAVDTYTIATLIPVLSPVSTGGTVVTWSVAPALPAGLGLNPATGQISGTPMVVSPQTAYTITGSNTGGSASAIIKITVNDLTPAIGYFPTTYVFTKGTAIAAITPTTAGGAVGSWAVSPALPPGLAFNTATGQITGTPTAPAAAANYTVTATNGEGSADAVLSITVKDIPPVIAYSPSSYVFTRGVAAGSNLPTSTGGTVVTWSVAPALPAGLNLNPATGQVSGTPTVLSPMTTYSVTGTNSGGSASTPLAITVNDVIPAFSYSPSSYTFSIGNAVAPISPTSTGGTVVTWTIAPSLPAGLLLNGSTGVITGTPTAVSPATTYTVSGTDTGGTTTASLTITVNGLPPATPVVTLATFVTTGNTGLTASTQDQGAGMTYAWTLTGGTITAGQGTTSITYTAGTVGTLTASVTVTNLVGNTSGSASATVVPAPSAELALPPSVHPGDTWMQAALPSQPGMTYLWSIVAGSATGTITSGQGTNVIGFSTGPATGTFQVQVNVQNQAGANVTATRTVTVQTGTWLVENGGPFLEQAYAPATLLPSGRVLVAGGQSFPNIVNTGAEIYDPEARNWTATGSLGLGRYGHTATLLANGQVMAAGGYGGAGMLSSVEIYDPVAGAWTATGGLVTPRFLHCAVLLASGKVLVAGGTGFSGVILASAEIYDPGTGIWTATGSLTDARTGFSATLLPNGQVLVEGGSGSTGSLASAEIYDPITGTWAITGSLANDRANHTATLLANGQVLVAGGYGSTGLLTSAELYNPASGTWAVTGSMTTPRVYHTATLLANGQVLATAGNNGVVLAVASAEVFNPATGTWTATGSLLLARSSHNATLLGNGQVLVSGGNYEGSAMASAEIYDPTMGSWTVSGPADPPRTGQASILLADGRALAAGGDGTSGYLSTSAIFDAHSGAWAATGSLNTARYTPTGTLLQDGTVLAAGGSAANPLASSEIFNPSSGIWTQTAGPLNAARNYHSATLLNDGTVLVAGGYGTGNQILASSEIYNPATGVWTMTPGSMSAARAFHTATLLPDGTVLVAGGKGTYPAVGSTEIYHPSTGTWTVTAGGLATARYSHFAVLLQNGLVLVAGGMDADQDQFTSAELYNPATQSWSATGSLGSYRVGSTAASLPDGRVMAIGDSGSGSAATDEIYDPVSGTWTPAQRMNNPHGSGTALALNNGSVLVAFGWPWNSVTEIYTPTPIPPPANLTYASSTVVSTDGMAITPDTPSETGGEATSYSISSGLPPGLVFDTTDGVISGTPTGAPGTYTFTINASNYYGSTQTTVTITVNAAPPTGLAYSANPAVFPLGTPITPDTPSSGGGAVTSYTVSPALPAGLNFDPSTGIISGTPTAAAALASYTVTAANSGGMTQAMLSLTVNAPPPATPSVSLATYVSSGKAGLTASTQNQGAGMTYAWTLTGGTITAGQGTPGITYTAGPVGTLTASVQVADSGGNASGQATATVVPMPSADLWMPTSVHPGDAWMLASVPNQPGMTYLWSILPGSTTATLGSGQGTDLITFSAGSPGGTFLVQADVQNQAGDSATAQQTVTAQAGTWLVENGGQVVPEHSATATQLASGRILLAGGFEPFGWSTRSTIYDPIAHTWAATSGSLGTARDYHTATLLMDGTVLAAGGSSKYGDVASSEIFSPATGTWTATTGSLGTPRHYHTATLLPDGTVLVAGGTGAGGALKTSEIYNPATGTWSPTTGTMAMARYAHTATLLQDGTVLVAGGYGQSGYLASSEIYNPATGSWTLTPGTLAADRSAHTATLLADGTVLVAGGYGDSGYLADSELYHPATGTWTATAASMVTARAYFSATLLQDGTVLAAGGYGNAGFLAGAEIYNPATGSWTATAGTLGTARYQPNAALLPDGTVLVVGGGAASGIIASPELYNPVTQTWGIPIQGLGTLRGWHTANLLQDGTVLASGGQDNLGNPLGTSEVYSPVTRTWTATAGSLNTPRYFDTSNLLQDGTVLVAGGFGPYAPLASSEIYTPATGTWNITAGPLTTARYNHTATLLQDGTVLAAGGYGPSTLLASSEVYNPATGTWTLTTGTLATARYFHTATLLQDGTVLVAGGFGMAGVLASCEIYHPATGTWTSTNGPLGTGRFNHTATLLPDGTVLVAGGEDYYGNTLGSSEIYQPATGTWTPAPGTLNNPRFNHDATLLPDGMVLVVGGQNPSGLLASAEIYNPPTGTWTVTGSLNVVRRGFATTLLGDGTVMASFGYGAETVTEIFLPPPPPPPANLSYVTSNPVYTAGVAITPDDPSETGGEATSYSISSDLPPGLVFDTTDGVISGTPTGPAFSGTFIITASNASGSTQTTITITTLGGTPPATPVVSLTPMVTAGTAGWTASTQNQGAGAAYLWTLADGTIVSGQGTPAILYTAGTTGTLTASVTVTNAGGSASGSASATVFPAPSAELVMPISVHPGDSWMQASVPNQPGMTYLWNVLSGSTTATLNGGQGTAVIDYSAGTTTGTFQVQADVQNALGANASAIRTVNVQTGTWLVENGSLPTPGAYATGTLLPSGRVLVAGGQDLVGNHLANSNIYDPGTGTWEPAGNLVTGRAYFTATLLQDGTVMAAGGWADSGFIASSEIYNPATGSWTSTTGSMSTARYWHTATLLRDGTVLVAGGSGNSGCLASSEIYNPATGAWTLTTGPLNTARQYQTATLLPNGSVLVVGGSGASGNPIASSEIYNPATGTWTPTTAPPATARAWATATLLQDGTVLVAGGLDANRNAQTSSEIYNPATGTWTTVPGSLTTGRYLQSANLLQDGTVLVAGGQDINGNLIASSEVFTPSTGSWNPTTGSLATARAYHTSALLQDGTVLVAGGLAVFPLASAEIYNPGTGTWALTPGSQGSEHAGPTATLLQDGTVLAAGGSASNDNASALASSERFNPAAGTWGPTGSLNTARFNHTATLLQDGTVLAAGGSGYPDYLAGAETYSPATGTWTPTGSLNFARTLHTATLLANGTVLVAGGAGGTGLVATAEIYNPAAGAWTLTGNLNTSRSYATATLLQDGTVLVAGGYDIGYNFIASAEIYNPATGVWTLLASGMNTARAGQTATLLQDGTVLVAGGFNRSGPLASSEIYNPVTGAWTPTAGSLGTAREHHTATLLQNGTVLAAGGQGNTAYYMASSELYDPATGIWTPTGDLVAARSYHTATLLNDGTVMAAFGYGPDVITEIYMPPPPLPPTSLSYPAGTATYTSGTAITPDTPTETGGEATSYSISSDLPPGLVFDTTDGVISGTPTGLAFSGSFTVTASNASGSTQTTITITVLGTVQGTALITYLPFDATTGVITPAAPVPWGIGTTAIKAILADGTSLPGTYNPATGAYSIPNVPPGYFWLKAKGNYTWTDLSTVDLGQVVPGRPNLVAASTATDVVFNTTGMVPWNDSDYLVFYDFNSSNYLHPDADAFSGYPNPGDTSLYALTMDWDGLDLVDTTQGDAPLLEQVAVTNIAGTENLWSAQAVYSPAPLTLVNGAESIIGGSFASFPQTSVFVNYSRSQFSAYRSLYNPNGSKPWGAFIEFDSQPGASAYGNASNWLDGLWVQNSDPSVTADLNLGPMAAPAPPLGFETIAYGGDTYYMDYTAPGATIPTQQSIPALRYYTLALPDATHPIQPVVSPVKNPTINGASLFTDQAGVGLTPTIAWTAPDLGTPTVSALFVYQLGVSGVTTTSTLVAKIRMEGTLTSTTLPDGLLTPGNYYWFLIRVVADPSHDPKAAPFLPNRFPYGHANVATNMITP